MPVGRRAEGVSLHGHLGKFDLPEWKLYRPPPRRQSGRPEQLKEWVVGGGLLEVGVAEQLAEADSAGGRKRSRALPGELS